MRIIAGRAKGRKLKSPKRDSLIKPILGRIRQSLFDTIRTRVPASHFLDLYAGTGIVGLEAISRGAEFVGFVEKSREAIGLIASNIEKLNTQNKTLVLQGDVLGASLIRLKSRVARDFFFDLVFSAPPYLGKDRRGEVLVMSVPTLERLLEAQVLASHAWVILQHHKREPIKAIPAQFKVFKEAWFGESMLTYLQYKSY